MLTPTTRKYLLRLLKVAHMTYQSPLIWDKDSNSFVLDTTRRFKWLSRFLFIIDCIGSIGVFILLIVNFQGNLRYSFTLMLLFFLITTVENVILDINMLTKAQQSLQFLNTFWRMVQSPQGTFALKTSIFLI